VSVIVLPPGGVADFSSTVSRAAHALQPLGRWRQSIMFMKLLMALGLRSAPAPVRNYLAVSSFFGALPALAYVAWKNRDKIRPVVQRVTSRRQAATAV
jgi:hypothetical protein